MTDEEIDTIVGNATITEEPHPPRLGANLRAFRLVLRSEYLEEPWTYPHPGPFGVKTRKIAIIKAFEAYLKNLDK